ncbi:MAG: acyl-CoA thioesterase [Phycisphaerales bacterium]
MSTSIPPGLSAVTVSIPLVWAEMDAFGHVNNIFYFRYFEIARIELLRRVGLMTPDAPPRGIGPILHSVHCRFRIPLTFPDTIDVTARVIALEADRLTLAHEITSRARSGALAAEGSGIVVAFDYDQARKAPIPAQVRSAILALGPPSGA